MELTSTVTIKGEDLRTNHEEADNILVHPMVVVASEENKGVSVISDTQMCLYSCYIIMSSRSLLG